MNFVFITDETLGKLCKWLRILGYNCQYFHNMKTVYHNLLMSSNCNLILLTRQKKLLRRIEDAAPCFKTLFIFSNDWKTQLKQVITTLSLSKPNKLFTRCINCNEILEKVARKEVSDCVPAFIYETNENFKQCPICHRIYWQGTHYNNMQKLVENLFQGSV